MNLKSANKSLYRTVFLYSVSCLPCGPQREKMYLRTIISVLDKQSNAECMMFLESVTLYLTRLFHLFCEL